MLRMFASDFLNRVHAVNWLIMTLGFGLALFSFLLKDQDNADFTWAFGTGLIMGTFTYFAIVSFFTVSFKLMRHRAVKVTESRVPDFVRPWLW